MSSISNKDKARIEHAASLAGDSSCVQRLGAVLTSGGRVMAVGYNSLRNASMVSTPYAHAEHAEMSVLRQARERAHGSTIYVARLRNDGKHAVALPCSRCMYRMMQAGVSRVVCTGNDEILELRLGRFEVSVYEEAASQVISSPRGFYRNHYLPLDLATN